MHTQPPRIRSGRLADLVAPAAIDIGDWVYYASIALTAIFAYVESLCPLDSRQKIVESLGPVFLTINIGGIAAVVAAGTIFASLSSRRFRLIVQNYDKLVSHFVWTALLLVVALMAGMLIYLASFAITLVYSKWYFWLATLVQLFFFCGLLQLFDSFRIVAVQMLMRNSSDPLRANPPPPASRRSA